MYITYKTYINDIYNDLKKNKNNQSIKCNCFKKRIKIFKKKDTLYINPNLKYVFRNCSVKEWLIISKKIVDILNIDSYRLEPSAIMTKLVVYYLQPKYKYLLSNYYHYSNKRIPKIKEKYSDISFLIKSLILNTDQDENHLKLIKKKLGRIGIANFKFVFEKNINKIDKVEMIEQESLSQNTKEILKHYFRNNRRKRNFYISKIRKDFIYDGYLLFFLNSNKYQLTDILFYKHNLNFFDYDFEVFVIKEK